MTRTIFHEIERLTLPIEHYQIFYNHELYWLNMTRKYINQPPVFYLAIRQRSEDLKHLSPGTGPTEIQG